MEQQQSTDNIPNQPHIKIDLNKYKKLSDTQQPSQQQQNKGFRPPVSEEEQFRAPPRQTYSEEELRRQAYQAREARIKQEALSSANFNYLDLFNKQLMQHKQAQNEFYNTQKQEDKEYDANKPAFFRNEPASSDPKFDSEQGEEGQRMSRKAEEFKAWKNLQKQMEMDFDPDTKNMEELREFFKISKEKNALDHMNEQVFEFLYERMKDRQIKFYAFLNKEFNIMNYKSARCSFHCFDSTERPLRQVNECLKLCREGLTGCREYALNLQKSAEADVEKCQSEAQNMKNMTDPIIHWISCYEKLILRFDSMEGEIKHEFSNFI